VELDDQRTTVRADGPSFGERRLHPSVLARARKALDNENLAELTKALNRIGRRRPLAHAYAQDGRERRARAVAPPLTRSSRHEQRDPRAEHGQ
jgi:hypothetical protein